MVGGGKKGVDIILVNFYKYFSFPFIKNLKRRKKNFTYSSHDDLNFGKSPI
jgi:hypothetical protein